MGKKQLVHAVVLSITILGAFLFVKTNLKNYDLQISALLFIILYLTRKFIATDTASKLIESVIFTFIVLIIVNSTGSLESPFFFLIYFLLFAISLLLEPIISVIATLNLIIYFLLNLPPDQSLKSILPIFSLAFLTPFAMYLGKEYLDLQKAKLSNQKNQQDTYLFLSLVVKNHLKNIREAADNFVGDKQLEIIKNSLSRVEKLIEKFESNTSA